MAEAEGRVCPRCGSPADHNAYCPECGFDLGSQAELPTRQQWIEERQGPPAEPAQPRAAAPPPAAPPPAGKAERPFMLRPVPLLVMAGVLVVVIAVVIIIAASGGGGESSRETVEHRVEALLTAPPYGVSNPKVECPSEVEFEAGKQVECHASAADGTTANVEAEVRSTSGEGELSIENLVQTDSITNQCSTEMEKFTHELGIATGSCDVTCPELVEANPNGSLSCHFSLEEGQKKGTVKIELASDGKTATGTWEATEE